MLSRVASIDERRRAKRLPPDGTASGADMVKTGNKGDLVKVGEGFCCGVRSQYCRDLPTLYLPRLPVMVFSRRLLQWGGERVDLWVCGFRGGGYRMPASVSRNSGEIYTEHDSRASLRE